MKRNLKDVLTHCRFNSKALMAFNLQNLYQLQAASKCALDRKLPLILQFSERFLRFLDETYSINYILNRYSNDYVYFHLDHCIDLAFIKYCIDSGFDSVMYDGSSFQLDKNIESTLIIKEYANKFDCLVEGELGKVSGVEDGFGEEGSSYAEINEIKTYVDKTNIDLMALGIGNAHGFYDSLEGIDLNILKQASEILEGKQFFVLHGGTGLPLDVVKETILHGVVKINVSTQLKKETMDILKDYAKGNILYNEIVFNKKIKNKLVIFFNDYLDKYTA